MPIDLEVIQKAYDWTINTNGDVCGLIAGDHGFMPCGIKLGEEDLAIWKAGLKALNYLPD